MSRTTSNSGKDWRGPVLGSPITSVLLSAVVLVTATLLPGAAWADHPCSTDPSETDYDPLCEQEGEVACNPLVPTTCLECWDCIDNDGDGLFDCMDNLDLEGNVNPNGSCAAYCAIINPIGNGAYDQDQDGDGFLACPWGPPDPAPAIYDCDDNESSINSGATEDCSDGVDNDCDGLVDASDPDCGGGDDDDSAPSGDDDDSSASGDDDDSSPPSDDDDSAPSGDDDSAPSGDDDSAPSGDDDSAPSGDDDSASSGDDDDDDDDSGVDDGCSCSATQSTVSTGLGLALLLGLGGLGLLRRRSGTRVAP